MAAFSKSADHGTAFDSERRQHFRQARQCRIYADLSRLVARDGSRLHHNALAKDSTRLIQKREAQHFRLNLPGRGSVMAVPVPSG
jgi:hypothetical protein